MAQQKIQSPLPGIFYRRPAPDQPVFKEAGDSVKKDEVIGLVEVMKSYFEVKSEVSGTISKFLVEDEGPVVAGQALAEVDS